MTCLIGIHVGYILSLYVSILNELVRLTERILMYYMASTRSYLQLILVSMLGNLGINIISRQ